MKKAIVLLFIVLASLLPNAEAQLFPGGRTAGTLLSSYAFRIELKVPSGVGVTPTTGGSLSAATYYFEVIAVDVDGGFTKPSSEVSCAISGGNNRCALTWTAVTGAASYRIFEGSTSGGEDRYKTSSTNSYNWDSNAGATLASPPDSTNAYVAIIDNLGVSSRLTGKLTVDSFRVIDGAVSSGYLWTATDSLGNGAWSAASTAAAHDILSATHTDSLAGTVTRGALIVGNSTPKWSLLSVGAADSILHSNGTDPTWKTIGDCDDTSGQHLNYDTTTDAFSCGTSTGAGSAHALLSATHSDTTAHTVVLGDLIYGDSNPLWIALAGNTTTTKKFLTQTGNGTISAAPSWATILAADYPDFVASGASHAKGAVPDPPSSSGTTKFLREDATWQVPSAGATTFSGARVTATGAQTLTDNTSTSITFNSETYDTNSYHDNSTNNERLTVPSTAYYHIMCELTFAANSTKNRAAAIRLNGSTLLATFREFAADSSNTSVVQVTTTYHLSASDYVECRGVQNSGGNLDVTVQYFMIEQLGT